jgi:hypothetical protein
MADPPDTERRRAALPAGTRVEVRNRFDGSWAQGFVVASADDDGGYRLTRVSDGAALPATFEPADVRRERKRQTWWV